MGTLGTMQLFSKAISAEPAEATAPAAKTPLNFTTDPHGLKRLKKCRAKTAEGMMRAATKILDEGTPRPIPSEVEDGRRYVDQRCKTIDPNFRRAPFSRVRSPREARNRVVSVRAGSLDSQKAAYPEGKCDSLCEPP
jgi:hypothetical protein